MKGRLVNVAAIVILNIHTEFGDEMSRSLIERDVEGKVRWHL